MDEAVALADLRFETEYRSQWFDMAGEFYVPALQVATTYKRAVGFFSSSALVAISPGIGSLARRGGHIRIVASPCLSEEDVKAIEAGYAERDSVVREALFRELREEIGDFSAQRLNLLANLIADGVLDIKIALPKGATGMYHEKMGIMEDDAGNILAFSGSMNETQAGLRNNYETIDVFRSWLGAEEQQRAERKSRLFDEIWNDTDPSLRVLHFPEVDEAIVHKYKRGDPDYDIDEREFGETSGNSDQRGPFAAGGGRMISEAPKLRPYQEDAVSEWKKHGCRGIFDMATGTGKTFAALGGARQLAQELEGALGIVVVCPYRHLVDQWAGEVKKFGYEPIRGYSAGTQANWKSAFVRALNRQKVSRPVKPFCLITTGASFRRREVQFQLRRASTPLLLIADEAHSLGAPSFRGILDDRFQYRLALSATLDRIYDEEGTKFLHDYFGDVCAEYSLEAAIEDGFLTPYKYHPILVHLTEGELERYDDLSRRIGKCLIVDRRGRTVLSDAGKILAIQRARVVAGASLKLDVLRDVMKDHSQDSHMLVYCGATNAVDEDGEPLVEDDSSGQRQVDAVTWMLENSMGMNVARFTACESPAERAEILSDFETGKALQALVAIKCLDEGVDVPSIRKAFILASTRNPKEFVQRRGRILRRAPGKEYAELYDFVTLPRPLEEVSGLLQETASRDLSLVIGELRRMNEFARLSLNEHDTLDLAWDIRDAYGLSIEDIESGVVRGREVCLE